jgi:hypothetical protein
MHPLTDVLFHHRRNQLTVDFTPLCPPSFYRSHNGINAHLRRYALSFWFVHVVLVLVFGLAIPWGIDPHTQSAATRPERILFLSPYRQLS